MDLSHAELEQQHAACTGSQRQLNQLSKLSGARIDAHFASMCMHTGLGCLCSVSIHLCCICCHLTCHHPQRVCCCGPEQLLYAWPTSQQPVKHTKNYDYGNNCCSALNTQKLVCSHFLASKMPSSARNSWAACLHCKCVITAMQRNSHLLCSH